MCNVCVAIEALSPGLRGYPQHGYEWGKYRLRARGEGAEFKPCKYQIRLSKWKKWPDLWLETGDLAGLVAEIGFDIKERFQEPREKKRPKEIFAQFEADHRKKVGKNK